MEDITELPEEFRPPEWLTDVIPRKSPYVPQMGDNVMYFKQGHELYLQAVKKRNVYKVDTRKHQPWHSNPNLRVRPCIVFQFTALLLYIRLVAVWLWKYFGCSYTRYLNNSTYFCRQSVVNLILLECIVCRRAKFYVR